MSPKAAGPGRVARKPTVVRTRRPSGGPVRTIAVRFPVAYLHIIEAEGAQREEGTGKLTWRLTAPAAGKVKIGFVYQLKRPRGYQVHQ